VPDVRMGNCKFFLKTVKGCYACNRYFVLVMRQIVCFASIHVVFLNYILVY